MSVNSRFIQVHQDALIEFIQDDQFYFEDDYSIIKDVKNNEVSFTFSKNVNVATNYNKIPNQLYLVDSLINRYGISDPDVKSFLQETKYINNQPSKYDKIKIWFPIHYNFAASTGFYLKSYTLDYTNKLKYNLSNFYLDTKVQSDLNKIDNEPTPFRLNQKLWGKSITLYIPSIYTEAQNRVNNNPTAGTINYNLTSGVSGLSTTSPIYFDFRFLSTKSTILNETTYITTPGIITNIPQAPEYNTLGVEISRATDGDYFLINGLYNGSIGEFENFMNVLEQSGRKSYVLYSITEYEDNLPQDTKDIYVYQEFIKKLTYRPIFKFTNTVASIRVDMKLISAVDSTVITKSSEIVLTGNEIAKYGKFVTPINITNAIKPKLYNSKPDQLVLPSADIINSHLKRKAQKKLEIRYVPYPVLMDVHNVVAQEMTVVKNNTSFSGFGDLKITLTPFDNIVKFGIFTKDGESNIKPFEIPSANTLVNLVFKSTTNELRIPLYVESNEVDLSKGIVVFKLTSKNNEVLKSIIKTSKIFYITLTTNGIETVLYDGTYELLSSTTRRDITTINLNGKLINVNKLKPVGKNTVSNTSNKNNSEFSLATDVLTQLNKNSLNTNQLKRLL